MPKEVIKFEAKALLALNGVTLKWVAPTNKDGSVIPGLTYNVYRGRSQGAINYKSNKLPITELTYFDPDVPAGIYWYGITAVVGTAESVQAKVMAVIGPVATPAPRGVVSTSVITTIITGT